MNLRSDNTALDRIHLYPEYTQFPRRWDTISSLPTLLDICLDTRRTSLTPDFRLRQRRVGDRSTWVIPFQDAQEVLRLAFSSDTSTFNDFVEDYIDPAALNGFTLSYDDDFKLFEILCDLLHLRPFAPRALSANVGEIYYTIPCQLAPKFNSWLRNVDITADCMHLGTRTCSCSFSRFLLPNVHVEIT